MDRGQVLYLWTDSFYMPYGLQEDYDESLVPRSFSCFSFAGHHASRFISYSHKWRIISDLNTYKAHLNKRTVSYYLWYLTHLIREIQYIKLNILAQAGELSLGIIRVWVELTEYVFG